MSKLDNKSSEKGDEFIKNVLKLADLLSASEVEREGLSDQTIKKIDRYKIQQEIKSKFNLYVSYLREKSSLFRFDKEQYDSFIQKEYESLVDEIFSSESWQQILWHKDEEDLTGPFNGIAISEDKVNIFSYNFNFQIKFDSGDIMKVSCYWDEEEHCHSRIGFDNFVEVVLYAPKCLELYFQLKLLMNFQSVFTGNKPPIKTRKKSEIPYDDLFREKKIADNLKVALINESFIDESGKWTQKSKNKSRY